MSDCCIADLDLFVHNAWLTDPRIQQRDNTTHAVYFARWLPTPDFNFLEPFSWYPTQARKVDFKKTWLTRCWALPAHERRVHFPGWIRDSLWRFFFSKPYDNTRGTMQHSLLLIQQLLPILFGCLTKPCGSGTFKLKEMASSVLERVFKQTVLQELHREARHQSWSVERRE